MQHAPENNSPNLSISSKPMLLPLTLQRENLEYFKFSVCITTFFSSSLPLVIPFLKIQPLQYLLPISSKSNVGENIISIFHLKTKYVAIVVRDNELNCLVMNSPPLVFNAKKNAKF